MASLEASWRRDLQAGLVLYDPRGALVRAAGPFRLHYLPGRERRPGSWNPPGTAPEGLLRPHASCPFDGGEFLEERGLLRLERHGRRYWIASNRFPVTAEHFLGVRVEAARGAHLSQCIHAREEVEDLLLFLAMLGPPYRVYFNSNRGADGSESGSSVNHWHFQFFPHPGGETSPIAARELEESSRRDGVRLGRVPGWPAHHAACEGEAARIAEIASSLWELVSRLNRQDSAYNLEAFLEGGGRVRAVLYGRRPAAGIEVPGAGTLPSNFGGWELSGDSVIPSREMFDALVGMADGGRGLQELRLFETTWAPDRELPEPRVSSGGAAAADRSRPPR